MMRARQDKIAYKAVYYKMMAVILCLSVMCAVREGRAAEYEDTLKSDPLYSFLTQTELESGIDGIKKAAVAIYENADETAFDVFNLWLRDAYYRENADPRYGLMYADTLHYRAMEWQFKDQDRYNRLMNDGAFAFFSSYLMALTDTGRCADVSAGQAYLNNWRPFKDDFMRYSMSLSFSERGALQEKVMAFEEVRKNRAENAPACANAQTPFGFVNNEKWKTAREFSRNQVNLYFETPQ